MPGPHRPFKMPPPDVRSYFTGNRRMNSQVVSPARLAPIGLARDGSSAPISGEYFPTIVLRLWVESLSIPSRYALRNAQLRMKPIRVLGIRTLVNRIGRGASSS